MMNRGGVHRRHRQEEDETEEETALRSAEAAEPAHRSLGLGVAKTMGNGLGEIGKGLGKGIAAMGDEMDDEHDPRDPLKNKKMRLLSYVLFLSVFVAASMLARDPSMYHLNSMVETILTLKSDELNGYPTPPCFEDMELVSHFYLYMQKTFASGIHSPLLMPGGGHPAQLATGYRIRQLRVKTVPCKEMQPSNTFAATLLSASMVATPHCFPHWHTAYASTAPFGPPDAATGLRPWNFSTAEQGHGTDLSMTGHLGVTYPAHEGFVVPNIPTNASAAMKMFSDMEANRWIDEQTRAVIIELSIFNPSNNYLTSVKLLAEFSSMGKVVASYTVKTFRPTDLVAMQDTKWWVECVLVAFVFSYSISEALEAYRATKREKAEAEERESVYSALRVHAAKGGSPPEGFRSWEDAMSAAMRDDTDAYFESEWNLVDLLNYGLFVAVICVEITARVLAAYGAEAARDALSAAQLARGSAELQSEDFFGVFVSFQGPAWLSGLAFTFLGLNSVVTWVKLLKYLNHFPHLSMLSRTLRNAYYPLVSYLVLAAIVFIGLSMAFFVAIGPYLLEYSTMTASALTLFRALLGDFDFKALQHADPVFGPLLFIIYIILVMMVLLNMFVAILAEAYEKAKIEVFGDFYTQQDPRWSSPEQVTFVEYTAASVAHAVSVMLKSPVTIATKLGVTKRTGSVLPHGGSMVIKHHKATGRGQASGREGHRGVAEDQFSTEGQLKEMHQDIKTMHDVLFDEDSHKSDGNTKHVADVKLAQVSSDIVQLRRAVERLAPPGALARLEQSTPASDGRVRLQPIPPIPTERDGDERTRVRVRKSPRKQPAMPEGP